jgi:hypothetical protein
MAVNYDTLMNFRNEMVRTATPDPLGDGVYRTDFWNTSIGGSFSQTDCEAKGLGYTWTGSHCFFPCPAAYTNMPDNVYKCEQRTETTELVNYINVIKSALSSCAEKVTALQGIKDSGGDPFNVPFPAGCPFPFTDDQQLIIPETYVDRHDPKGVAGTPATRITFLSDELDAIPKAMGIGGRLEDDPLVANLRSNSTYVDSHPEHLKRMMELVPTFTWSVKFTQSDFDKLDYQWQCRFCDNPNLIYDDPSVIAGLRTFMPELEITRGAPDPMPTKFRNCPEDIVRKQCDEANDNLRKKITDQRECNFSRVDGTGCQAKCVPISPDGCPPPERKSNFWGDFGGVFTNFFGGVGNVVGGVVNGIVGTANDLEWLYNNAEYIAIGGVVLYVVMSLDSGEGGGGTVIVSAPAPASK